MVVTNITLRQMAPTLDSFYKYFLIAYSMSDIVISPEKVALFMDKT